MWPRGRGRRRGCRVRSRLCGRAGRVVVDGYGFWFGGEGAVGEADGFLGFFDGAEGAGGEEREDAGAEAGGYAVGDEDGLVEDVGVDLVEDCVLLRDAAGVDDAVDGDAVFGHALEDDAGVEGGAFDGGEELVLRGVEEVPAEGDAAEFGVDEDGAVAVVPAEAEEAGLAGAIGFEALGEVGDCDAGAAGDGFEDVAGGGEAGFDAGEAGWTLPGTTPQTPGTSSAFLAMAMMQVEVPTTLTTSPSRQPAPMASQWASKAPTGMGMPAWRPSSAAHFWERWPAM